MSTLELRDVSLTVAGRALVGPLSCAVESGTILTISGPSGVGKSSLLAFLCGVLPSTLISLRGSKCCCLVVRAELAATVKRAIGCL